MEGPGEVSIRLEQPQEQSLRVGMTDANGAERCATDPFHDSSIEQSIPDRIQYGRVGVQANHGQGRRCPSYGSQGMKASWRWSSRTQAWTSFMQAF